MLERQTHKFGKLSRGTHPGYQAPDALWDAHNIRLTSRTGESLECITNEKSTKELFSFNSIADGNATYYIGHTVINDWLVLMLTVPDSANPDFILRINLSDDTFLSKGYIDNCVHGYNYPIQILYNGDLGFDREHPAQVIQDYEAELIQKVYWTDGINRPRLINIAKPELKECTEENYDSSTGFSDIYHDAPFDFVQELSLQEECSVERVSGKAGGEFPACAIQYACSYAFKYQQETNLFYTSELLYTSYTDRGASAEDTSINNAFQITIKNPEVKFDYLRIYSIQRTALNGTPVCQKIADIDLSEVKDGGTVTFIDTNTTGEDVDSSSLYIDSKDILAGCIECKENDVFLGNITYQRQDVNKIVEDNTITFGSPEYTTRELSYDNPSQIKGSSFYQYINQLSQNSSTFKTGETYRLGIQFQDITGSWSDPIFLGDVANYVYNAPKAVFGSSAMTLTIPSFEMDISSGILSTFYNEGYRKVRGVIVFPNDYEKDVICEGIVCPTVFNLRTRGNNAPFVYPSWFFRPMGVTPTGEQNTGLNGAVVEWRHLHPLTSGLSSGAEVQNMNIAEVDCIKKGKLVEVTSTNRWLVLKQRKSIWDVLDGLNYDYNAVSGSAKKIAFENYIGSDYKQAYRGLSINYADLHTASRMYNEGISAYNQFWYVDASVCTLNSPDIVSNEALVHLIKNNDALKVRIKGLIPFNSAIGYCDIDLTSVQICAEANGINDEYSYNYSNGAYGLCSALLFNDAIIDDWKEYFNMTNYNEDDDHRHFVSNWMVYPWHRSGSLNNDSVRPDGEQKSAELNTKILSNIKYSNNTIWIIPDENEGDDLSALILNTTAIDVVSSDSLELVKLYDEYINDYKDNYYNVVDFMSGSYTPFKLVKGVSNASTIDSSSDDEDEDDDETTYTVVISNITEGTTYLLPTDSLTIQYNGTSYSNVTSNRNDDYIEVYLNDSYSITTDSDTGNYILELTGTINNTTITIDWSDILETNSSTNSSEEFDLDGCTVTITIQIGADFEDYLNGTNYFQVQIDDTFTSERLQKSGAVSTSVYTFTVNEFDAYSKVNTLYDLIDFTLINLIDNQSSALTEQLIYMHRNPNKVKNYYDYTYYDDDDSDIGDKFTSLLYPKEAVRIKYRTTPHVVFNFGYSKTTNGSMYRDCLPLWNANDNEYIALFKYAPSSDHLKGYYNNNNSLRVTCGDMYWATNYDEDNTDNLYYSELAIPTSRLSYAEYNIPSYLWMCELYQENVTNKFGGDSYEALLNNTWLPAGEAVYFDGLSNITVSWIWGDTWYQRWDCLKTYPYTNEDTNQIVEIGSFMVESKFNLDGRYDRNRGLTDNTTMSPTNFNLINTVYSQKNNFFSYQIQDKDYYKVTNYPNELFYSAETKSPGAIIDSWTNLHMATSMDLDGSNGAIESIVASNNSVYVLQNKAVNNINFNARAAIDAGDGVPIEIAGAKKVDGYNVVSDTIGCQDKFSVLATTLGVYFVDNNNCTAYFIDRNGNIINLKEKLGSIFWFKENRSDVEWRQIMIPYNISDVTENSDEYQYIGKQNSLRLYYDPKYCDLYFVPGYDSINTRRECIVLNEDIAIDNKNGAFISFMNYDGAVMLPHKGRMFSIAYDASENSADITSLKIWENWADDEYTFNNIFGEIRPYSFSFIANESPTITKIFDNVEIRVDCYDYDETTGIIDLEDKDGIFSIAEQAGQPFNYMRVNNEYQDTGNVAIDAKNLRKKFRVWRAQIPRNKDARDRIRNTWAKITFGNSSPDTKLMILHDIDVNYSI